MHASCGHCDRTPPTQTLARSIHPQLPPPLTTTSTTFTSIPTTPHRLLPHSPSHLPSTINKSISRSFPRTRRCDALNRPSETSQPLWVLRSAYPSAYSTANPATAPCFEPNPAAVRPISDLDQDDLRRGIARSLCRIQQLVLLSVGLDYLLSYGHSVWLGKACDLMFEYTCYRKIALS